MRKILVAGLAAAVLLCLLWGWWRTPPANRAARERVAPGRAGGDRVSMVAPGGTSKRLAFRLLVDRGGVSVAGWCELEGDFGPRRGTPAMRNGMLHCALVDASGRILDEETLPDPAQPCALLGRGPDGAVVRRGPVLCQVRLAEAAGAAAMEVRRVEGGVPGSLLERRTLP